MVSFSPATFGLYSNILESLKSFQFRLTPGYVILSGLPLVVI